MESGTTHADRTDRPDRMGTILVADDEDLMVRTLEYGLRREGYTVVTARNGKEALGQFLRHRPDLVLLDAMMPLMDGFEACRQLRAVSDVPIIFVTALDGEQDVIDGIRTYGANGYVTKPFRMGEVLARIHGTLRDFAARARQQDSLQGRSLLAGGQLVIDHDQRQVYVSGAPVALVPTEYRLLEYLVRNRGVVLSKEQITRAVWGHAPEVYDDVVKVYVSSLRQKIEPDPKRPRFIITRRQFGYMFSAEPAPSAAEG